MVEQFGYNKNLPKIIEILFYGKFCWLLMKQLSGLKATGIFNVYVLIPRQ
jgi:hypothetical protein